MNKIIKFLFYSLFIVVIIGIELSNINNDDSGKNTYLAASTLSSTTNASGVSSVLNNIYGSLNNIFTYETNKFNCSSSGCSTSSYNNIGLLSKKDYDLVGGADSYLKILDSYFILDDGSVKVLNSDNTVTNGSTSKVRPVIYLQTNTKVTGKGTVEQPYVFEGVSNLSDYILFSNENVDTTCTSITCALDELYNLFN